MAKENAAATVVEDDPFAADMDESPDTTEADSDETPAVKTEKVFRRLECLLTNSEKIARGEENARAIKELSRVQSEKKEVANRYKAMEEKLTNDIDRLSDIVDTGREMRSVECEHVVDYKANRVTVTRLDTFATVEDRKLNKDEAQIAMDLLEEDDED